MPRIPTFDAGEGRLQPSEAGSAAYREAGAITQRNAARAGAMIEQTGTSISGGLKAFGGAVGKLESDAQDHNDAQADIDFQNQLTKAEIAAQGGVNLAGSPRDDSGQPIADNPARSGSTLPDNVSVPSPGQYATAADSTLKGHATFLDNLLGNISGFGGGVSQRQRDKMALEVAKSNRRLQVHAAAVDGEVAFNHALTTTGETEKQIYGAVNRGDLPLDAALDHIDRTYGALSGALSGDFAGKGAPLIEKAQTQAKQNAIWQAASGEMMKGHVDQAQAIINDKKYDKYVGGGVRDSMLGDLAKVQQQWQKAQTEAESQKDALRTTQQGQLVDSIYRNGRLPQDQQDPNLNRLALEKSSLFAGKPEELEKARKTLDSLTNNTIDPNKSTLMSANASRAITAGSITTPGQIDQLFQPDKPDSSITWQDRNKLQQELKDAKDRPDVKEFNGAASEWMKRNEASFDPNAAVGQAGHTQLGQQMVSRWQAELQRRAQIMRANGEDPHQLLDPNNPKSMVTPQALAPYRATMEMQTEYGKAQGAADKDINAQRSAGQVPSGKVEIPSNLKSIPNVGFNPQTQQWQDPATKKIYNLDGSKATMSLQPPAATPDLTKPVVMPKGTTPDQIKQQLQPGQKFIIEHDDGKKYMGTVPGKRSMNFAPEGGGMENSAGQQAINSAIVPVDAHEDKNLFSSGRYEAMGIAGGVGENLTRIEVQGKPVTVNAQAAPHFKAFLDELTARGYKVDDIGGYNDRMKRGSLSSYSEHAFGNAIDINPDRNPFHSRKNDLPSNVAQIAAKYGLIWGGNWSGRSADPMHFEWSGKGGQTKFAGL